MRQLGEKKNLYELCGTLLPFKFSSWGKGGGGMIFFLQEKWKFSVKGGPVPCFGEAQEQQSQRAVSLVQGIVL